MKVPHRTVLRRRQRGAALVVGLLLLTVITLLAISGMNTATVELKMAGNMQFAQNAFQNAETGLERTMPLFTRDAPMPTLPSQGISSDSPGDEKVVAGTNSSIMTGRSEVPGGGFSMGVGAGFYAYHYEIVSTGTSALNARSVNTQSFYIVGRK